VVFVGSLLAYPITVRILLIPVSWYLLAWLFDLNGRDLVCTIVGLWVFHIVLWLLYLVIGAPLDPRRLPERKLPDVEAVVVGRRGTGGLPRDVPPRVYSSAARAVSFVCRGVQDEPPFDRPGPAGLQG
jgi:hypothetical protein